MKQFFRNIGDFFLSVIKSILLVVFLAWCGVWGAAQLLVLATVTLPIIGAIAAIHYRSSFYDAIMDFFRWIGDVISEAID